MKSKIKTKAPSQKVANIVIEGAMIRFRNFSGKESKFNPAGRRNFCVILDPEVAKDLIEIGWNVRWLKPTDPSEPETPYLSVAVSYKNRPPKIMVISSKSKAKNLFDESTIDILDWAEIENVDLIIQPYNWEVNDKTGIKAYLKTAYITIVEDEFEQKYRDAPDSALSHEDDGD